jgi:hypothetical protein
MGATSHEIVAIGRTWWAQSSMAEFEAAAKEGIFKAAEDNAANSSPITVLF